MGTLSKTRLARLHDALSAHVSPTDVPGIVALVSRRDETHVVTFGRQSLESDAPMQRDTIFRIASMTKPVTAAAAMILVEQCKLRLDDPVDGLLPELANRRVLKSLESPIDDTVPAETADHAARSAHLHLRPGRGDGVAGQASHPEGDGRGWRGAKSESDRAFRPTSS